MSKVAQKYQCGQLQYLGGVYIASGLFYISLIIDTLSYTSSNIVHTLGCKFQYNHLPFQFRRSIYCNKSGYSTISKIPVGKISPILQAVHLFCHLY